MNVSPYCSTLLSTSSQVCVINASRLVLDDNALKPHPQEFVSHSLGVNDIGLKLLEDYIQVDLFPNPVDQGMIRINYELRKTSDISISIYNLSGVQLAKLANENQQEIGSYFVHYDVSHLPTNIYFYRINTDWGSYIGKFIKINK